MVWSYLLGAAASLALLFVGVGHAGSSANETLQINHLPDQYELSVPVSRLMLTIPKGTLVPQEARQGGSTENPRYFAFRATTRTLFLSGWFEPAARFRGLTRTWEEDTSTWQRRGMPAPRDVVFDTHGTWQIVRYDMPGSQETNAHLRAHWIQTGTWIDVHLSIMAPQPSAACRAILQDVLQSLQVREKP